MPQKPRFDVKKINKALEPARKWVKKRLAQLQKETKPATDWTVKSAKKATKELNKRFNQATTMAQRFIVLGIIIFTILLIEGFSSSIGGGVKYLGVLLNLFLSGYLIYYGLALMKIYIWRPYEEVHGRPAPRILINIASVAITFIVIAFVTTVILDREIGAVFAGLSFLGAGVALALQSPILDTFSGGVIDIERPIQVGDWIKIDGYEGQVIDMGWRSTVLKEAPLGNMIFIPNSKFSTNTLVNYSRPGKTYKEQIKISLDYIVPVDRAKRVLESALYKVPEVKDSGSAQVFAWETTTGGVDFMIFYDCPDLGSRGILRHKVQSSILHELDKYGMKVSESIGEYMLSKGHPGPYAAMPERDAKHAVDSIDLFASLKPDEKKILIDGLREHKLKAGMDIVLQGKDGDSMFIIEEGAVEVMVALKKGQQPQRVAILTSGAFFGDMALLTGEKRSATVRAMTSLRVFEIRKETLVPLFQKSPALMQKLAEVVAERKMANKKLKISVEKATKEVKKEASGILSKIKSFFTIDANA